LPFYPCFYFGNFKRLLAYFLSPLFSLCCPLQLAASALALPILFNLILFYISFDQVCSAFSVGVVAYLTGI